MKKIIRNIVILFFPVFLMIIINESVRPTIKEKPVLINGIKAINSAVKTPDKCTWYCHNNTTYCKNNHVKFNKRYFKYSDPLYFGIINLLKLSGYYRLANIFFLVILFPLLIYYLLIKSLDMQKQIKELKGKNE